MTQCELDAKSSEGRNKVFKWKGKNVQVPSITQQLPIDIQQVSDLFLHIYTSSFKGTSRIGYVRVHPSDGSVSHNFGTWYQIKDPTNNYEGKSPGLILANIRLLQGEATKMQRPQTRYDSEAELNFYAYVYSGVELAPDVDNDSVRARIELSFCDLRPNQDNFLEEKKLKVTTSANQPQNPMIDQKALEDKQGAPRATKDKASTPTKDKKGSEKKKKKHSMIIESDHITKNPIFGAEQKGEFIMSSAKVTGGLDMAPSLLVNVYNVEKKSLVSSLASLMNMGSNSAELIGSCYIQPSKCKIIKGAPGELNNVEPQFYSIIGADGRIQGKILMFVGFSKNIKESLPEAEFKKAFDLKMKKFKLDFCCVGLRNLDSQCPTPEVTLRIPSYQLMIKFKPAKNQGEYDAEAKKKKNKLLNKKGANPKGNEPAEQPQEDRKLPVLFGETSLYFNEMLEDSNYISNLKEYNPNLCLTSSVQEISLPEQALLWPRAEIEVTYKNMLRMESKYFLNVDLVECCPNYPKSNAAVMKEKLGMQKRATETAGDKQESEDKGMIGLANEVGGGHTDPRAAADHVPQHHQGHQYGRGRQGQALEEADCCQDSQGADREGREREAR